MSDVVSAVLKLTFGFLAKKIRKEIAQRLKDGDVTAEECRRLIVTELDDIRSKLDGLARKDLISSFRFLQEGINGLYQSLLQFPSDQNTIEQLTERANLVEASSSKVADHNFPSSINEAVALINATTLLKIHSKERFKSAIKSFQLAREKATEAFCNEALSIEDRIQASQIRMMARILEKLEDPEASVSDCLQYLKQLHDVGAICEVFSVMINGGMKSRFNRVKRLSIASSVQDMNGILFDFARKFTKSLLTSIFRWPIILLGKKTYHPVFEEKKLVLQREQSWLQVMSLMYSDFTFDDLIDHECSVVNSKGEIVAKIRNQKIIKIFQRSGKSRTVCEVPVEEHASEWQVAAMDIDAEDNIYVITAFRETHHLSWSFKLFISDENGNKKLETLLHFHQSFAYPVVRMAINKDGRIVILNYDEKILYIGKVCVEMNSYEVDGSFGPFEFNLSYTENLRILELNETKLIFSVYYTVYVFTENGLLQHQIEIPHEHGFVKSVVINHATKRILVKTLGGDCSNLLSYSESGDLLCSSYLGSSYWIKHANLISHPNGPVALLSGKEAVLLQQ